MTILYKLIVRPI